MSIDPAPPPPGTPAPGPAGAPPRTIGRYQVQRELARGGMGVVLLAWDPHLQAQRAIKVLHGLGQQSAEERERFLREAQVLARLRHPNLIPVLDAGQEGGSPFLVLPLLRGGSLAQRLASGGPLEPRAAATLVDKVARAVDHAHGEGVVHRDLKPANVLLDDDGAPIVTDFGIAGDAASRDGLTRTGQLLGTPSYMAPEQALGLKAEVGPRTDVYALGAILYELLAGRPPHVGAAPMEIVNAVVTRPIEPLARLRPDVPPDLAAVAHHALDREPRRRYDSAAALAADLRRFLDGQPVHARPKAAGERAARFVGRHAALGAGLVVVGGAALAAGLSLRSERLDARAEAEEVLGLEALARGERDVAREHLARARDADPGRVRALRGLAQLAVEAGDAGAARRAVAELAARTPGSSEALALEACALALEGDFAGADARRAEAERALAAQDAALRARLVAALEAAGRLDAVRAALAAASAPEDLERRARAHRALGARVAAEADEWRALAARPSAPGPIERVLDGRLRAGEGEALTRLWEAVDRGLRRPGEVALLRGHDADEAALEEAALDARDPRARLRAALGLGLHPSARARATLERLAAGRAPASTSPASASPARTSPAGEVDAGDARDPVLAEAARSSLLALRLLSPDAWAAAARAAAPGADAPAALTLAEVGERLGPGEGDALLGLADAPGPRLRAVLAVAAARAAARGGWVDRAAADELLARLARDGDERVRDAAAAAAGALAIALGPGELGVHEAAALTLAADLADAPLAAGTNVEHVERRVERALELALEARPGDVAALVCRARWRLARGLVAPALADAAAARRGAVDVDALALAVAAGPEDRPARDALRALDPVAADEAERAAALARAYRVVALPRPGGTLRLVVPGRADAVLAAAPPEVREGWTDIGEAGVSHPGPLVLGLAPRALEVERVRVDGSFDGTQAYPFGITLHPGPRSPSGLNAWLHIGCSIHQDVETRLVDAPLPAVWPEGGLALCRRRGETRFDGVAPGLDGGPTFEPLARGPTLARAMSDADAVRVIAGGKPGRPYVLRRVVVDGAFALAPEVAPPRRDLVALRAIPWLEPPPDGVVEAGPDRARLVARGRIIAADLRGPVRAVRLRGDGAIQARLACEGLPSDAYAGIGLRSVRDPRTRVFLGLHGDALLGAGNGPGWAVTTEVGAVWETFCAQGPAPKGAARLELRRRGDHITCAVGPDGQTPPVVAQLDFPVLDEVELVLFARDWEGGGAPGTAAFDEVRVLVEDEP